MATITFCRLTEIDATKILAHMAEARVSEHLPLVDFEWDIAAVQRLVSAKEAAWARDGLGHWAILRDGNYVGWGGFQKEGEEWDFGLVLRSDAFGLGVGITRIALDFARSDQRIPFVTFLLPPSRRHLGALARLGASACGEVLHDGVRFLKFRLDTPVHD